MDALAKLYTLAMFAVTEGAMRGESMVEGYVQVFKLMQEVSAALGLPSPPAEECLLCNRPLDGSHDPDCGGW